MHTIRRTENAKTPVIVVSLVAEPGVSAGFCIQDHLTKPIDVAEIDAAFRRVLGPPRPAEACD